VSQVRGKPAIPSWTGGRAAPRRAARPRTVSTISGERAPRKAASAANYLTGCCESRCRSKTPWRTRRRYPSREWWRKPQSAASRV